MPKSSPKRKPAVPSPPADEAEAALCQHELDARRENEMRATRKRDMESQARAGDDAKK
jgi:hypothetical protein